MTISLEAVGSEKVLASLEENRTISDTSEDLGLSKLVTRRLVTRALVGSVEALHFYGIPEGEWITFLLSQWTGDPAEVCELLGKGPRELLDDIPDEDTREVSYLHGSFSPSHRVKVSRGEWQAIRRRVLRLSQAAPRPRPVTPRRRRTLRRNADIIRRARSGETMASLAREFALSREGVRIILKSGLGDQSYEDLEVARAERKLRDLISPMSVVELISSLRNGGTLLETASKFEIEPNTISRCLKKILGGDALHELFCDSRIARGNQQGLERARPIAGDLSGSEELRSFREAWSLCTKKSVQGRDARHRLILKTEDCSVLSKLVSLLKTVGPKKRLSLIVNLPLREVDTKALISQLSSIGLKRSEIRLSIHPSFESIRYDLLTFSRLFRDVLTLLDFDLPDRIPAF